MPNMRWAFNRWLRTVTESRGGWWPIDLKAAVFHPMQIQKLMAGERQLPAETEGVPDKASNEVRAIASASDDGSGRQRVLVAKFNNNFDDTSAEEVSVRLSGLPPVKSVLVRENLIDATHNNWFADWRKFREANGIEYKSRTFGPWAKLATHYLPSMNDIYGTTQDKDLPVFKEKADQYKKEEALSVTREYSVAVTNGTAALTFEMVGPSVMYIETVCDFDVPLTATVKPNVARIDYYAGLNSVQCFGKRIAEPNRLVATAAANQKGEIEVVLSVPQQESDADAAVEFNDVRVVRAEW